LRVWQREYTTLYHQNERGQRLLSQCQSEKSKMEQTAQLSTELVANLKAQITKYRDSDQFVDRALSDSDSDKDWKSRYLTEKRQSQYLRDEIADLETQMEELKEKKFEADQVHEAWEEEVTSLFERLRANNVDTDHLFDAVQRGLSRIDINRKDVVGDGTDYKALYQQSVASKLHLIDQTSAEIQRLREVIKFQNPEGFKFVLDKVARYHNLDGKDDTLFQLIVDANLKRH